MQEVEAQTEWIIRQEMKEEAEPQASYKFHLL
jgi:hypothetical protein